jgi:hypothetical protein
VGDFVCAFIDLGVGLFFALLVCMAGQVFWGCPIIGFADVASAANVIFRQSRWLPQQKYSGRIGCRWRGFPKVMRAVTRRVGLSCFIVHMTRVSTGQRLGYLLQANGFRSGAV